MTALYVCLVGLVLAVLCSILKANLIKGEKLIETLEKVGLIMFGVGLLALNKGQ